MRRAVLQAAVLILVVSGCGLWSSVDSAFSTATLTQEPAGDTYSLAWNSTTGAATVTASNSNTGGNNRGLFWPAGQPVSRDAESCARWALENNSTTVAQNIQEGAAMRIRTNGDGSIDAVTVTRNVWYGAVWIFNEHIWNTNQDPTFTLLGHVDLKPVFDPSGDPSKPAPLPWLICTKTVGSQLSFVAWLEGTPRPDYGDTSHGGSITLPVQYVYAGNYGWYIGHLTAGQRVVFDNLVTNAL